MSNTLRGNAVIGQSGGPTSVINQSLVGLIRAIRKSGHIDKLLGARHGVKGIVAENFIGLDDVPDELLNRIATTPAAALGSTRDKPDREYCERIARVFQKHDVRYFFYIGGNDSADTARIVSDLGKESKYELRVFHVPKTIDNDLKVTDHCPGYGSAARYVAAAIMGDNFDNRSLPGIKVDVIMGRHAGFLTASSVLARHHDEDGPHLIYVPESPLSEEQFLADVDRVYKKQGRCLIAVSEGIVTPDGKTWYERMAEHFERDSHGNVVLSGSGALGDYMADRIRASLGQKLRVRADTFGYVQRGFPFVSETDAREARMVGEDAARYSLTEDGGSIALRRIPGPTYRIETFLTPLDTVAKHTRQMHPSYYVDGNNITEAFKQYARPLIGDLPRVGTFDELEVPGAR